MTNTCELLKRCIHRADDSVCRINIACKPVVENCDGCIRIEDGYCRSFAFPAIKWRSMGGCPMASHIVAEAYTIGKIRAGQQKQKKKTRK